MTQAIHTSVILCHRLIHQYNITAKLNWEMALPFQHLFSYVWDIIIISNNNFHYFIH
jgi:hypothetical protein